MCDGRHRFTCACAMFGSSGPLHCAPFLLAEVQMSERPNYCWIVPCKNDLFHQQREYLYFRHPYITHGIALAPTDAFAPLPTLDEHFLVQCDECGETYTYTPAEVCKSEQDLPESFTSHPLFSNEWP